MVALAHSLANGVIVGMLCWALGVPAALSLGAIVGAFTILPLMRVLVGGVPARLLAFGSEGGLTGAVVLIALLLLQLVEAAIVRPRVDPATRPARPAAAIVVGLLGFELYGVGGAVYGIAIAVIAFATLDAPSRARGEDVTGSGAG